MTRILRFVIPGAPKVRTLNPETSTASPLDSGLAGYARAPE
jgi:hypothetical protein